MSTETETAPLFPAGAESEPTALPPWVTVVQCLITKCAECEAPLGDQYDDVTYHYPTIQDLYEDMKRQEWAIGTKGPLCEECSADAEVSA